jgi:predicted RNase H-like nuclease (RuvC/YqgF family)
VGSGNNDAPRFIRSATDTRRLRKELEDKKKAVKQLEENLRRQKEEARKIRSEAEDAQRYRDEEVQLLHAEIKILGQQCNTNMEVLTRKERELAVLRDSLRVEDDDVGYISDDNSEAEYDMEHENAPTSTAPLGAAQYGPSQAEVLATLLAQGGNHTFDSGTVGAVTNQIEALRAELVQVRAEHEKTVRHLKVEKESLSNANMIISSLERANKSMMEDLRSRLQDSNTAIASLLENH